MRLAGHRCKQFAGDLRGASAVEFAIIAPVFLFMLFGMIAYAIYFGALHSIQQLAADASRTAIAGLSEAERQTLVAGFITGNAGTYMLIDPDRLSFESSDDADDPSQFRLALSYDASALPIWNLSVPLPLPSATIRYAATIRKGGL